MKDTYFVLRSTTFAYKLNVPIPLFTKELGHKILNNEYEIPHSPEKTIYSYVT